MAVAKRLLHILALAASLHHHTEHAPERHLDVALLLRAASHRRVIAY